MDLGFETIGNATLIAHDRGPVLVTDPWILGDAYFGSWIRSHEIPAEVMSSIGSAKFAWISHGHPDHLSLESLEAIRHQTILLPDHVGSRIAGDLREMGFKVQVLADGVWTPLTDRLRVASVSDFNQDAMLFLEFEGGVLVINANDATDRGVGDFLVSQIARAKVSYLLWLTGYGDADMLNVHDESGKLILPGAAAKHPIGPTIQGVLEALGIRYFVPFSSMHRYQRADSIWANEYTTPIEDHAKGFDSKKSEILPAFARIDLANDRVERIECAPVADRVVDPKQFGDDWSEQLSAEEARDLHEYLRGVHHLTTFLDFVEFRVGGRSHVIDLGKGHGRGLRFETPRGSLVTAVKYKIFDDLMIGNFTKTTLLGKHERTGTAALYPHFIPFIAKYADNGLARTPEELRRYFESYKKRGFLNFFRSVAAQEAAAAIRPYLPE